MYYIISDYEPFSEDAEEIIPAYDDVSNLAPVDGNGYQTYTAARWVADTLSLDYQKRDDIKHTYIIQWVPDNVSPVIEVHYDGVAPTPTNYEHINGAVGVQHWDYEYYEPPYSEHVLNPALVTVT